MKQINFNLGVKIRGMGTSLPSARFHNTDLLKIHPEFSSQEPRRLELLSGRLKAELGFEHRHFSHIPGTPLSVTELNSEKLTLEALQKAKKSSPDFVPEIFIHGTTTSSRYCGSQATALAGALGWEIPSYETKAGCSTSLASLHLAWSLLQTSYDRCAIACGETLSKVIHPGRRDDWFGLADGAAALYLERATKNADVKILRSVYSCKGQLADLYTTPGQLPPDSEPREDKFFLAGDAESLRVHVKAGYEELLTELFRETKDEGSITHVIPHQVNVPLIREILPRFGITGKLLLNVGEIGNIGGASILYSVCDHFAKNIFSPGDRILLLSVGGGLSLAGQVWEIPE